MIVKTVPLCITFKAEDIWSWKRLHTRFLRRGRHHAQFSETLNRIYCELRPCTEKHALTHANGEAHYFAKLVIIKINCYTYLFFLFKY